MFKHQNRFTILFGRLLFNNYAYARPFLYSLIVLSRDMTYLFILCSKKVSKSLESDFSNKMNHLLRTVLQKQRQQRIMEDFGGYYDEPIYWRQNDQIQNTENVASAPCPLDPVSHLTAHQQESWQHSSFGSQHHDNQNFLVSELLLRVTFSFLLQGIGCGSSRSYKIFCCRKWRSG